MLLRSPTPSRTAPLAVALAVAVLSGACSGTPAATPTATEVVAADVVLVDLPDGGTPFLAVDGGVEVPLASRCATSTPARSTVIAADPDGREIAVTVFVSDEPTVEVDVVDADGGNLLTTRDLGAGRWAFRGATLVGAGAVRGTEGSVEVEFAIDFSADLPDCDNQDELGPGNDPEDEGTPDVIRT